MRRSSLTAVLIATFAAASVAQLGPTLQPNPWAQFVSAQLNYQLVPSASISSISKTLEETGRELDIFGNNFSQFVPRWNLTGSYTPMVLFGTTSGTQGQASFTVLSNTRIRATIPASAVNGPVALVYRRIPVIIFAGTTPRPSYVLVAQSSASFTVGIGIRIENTDAQQNLTYVSVASAAGTIEIIGPAQPDPARQLLTPYNNAGSISPRVIVPADLPSTITYQLGPGSNQSLIWPVLFPRTSRWRLGIPSGMLTATL